MQAPEDYVARVFGMTRAQFVERFPHHFLVDVDARRRPKRNFAPEFYEVATGLISKPAPVEADAPREVISDAPTRGVGIGFASGGTASREDAPPLVFALRKSKPTFSTIISVGRDRNNDVVIEDERVSRFHAFFSFHPGQPGRIDVGDAGSANGTFVGTKRLEPKGPTMTVSPGARVTIATFEFDLLDAGGTWDRVHAGVE